MSATNIYDNAPLGSLILYADGTAKPPARFTKKLAAWEARNGIGRLVKKTPPRMYPNGTLPATITLHEGNFASNGIILVTVMRTFSTDSNLTFDIASPPAVGNVRVLQAYGGDSELVHLAESREAAELWLAKNRYSNVRLEEVTGDETADPGSSEPVPLAAE
jgi:hypothetical protein